jgi:Ca2+-binding EF-hand superfamily protein
VIAVLEKIHSYFIDKKYNKTQIFAIFDRHSNGLITREEFLETLKTLQIEVPLEHANSVANYINQNDTGVLDIEVFISRMVESVPE